MKKFVFALDTVLDYRRQMMDALQVEMSALMAQVHAQELTLQGARQRHVETNGEYRKKQAVGMTIAEARGYETGLRALEAEIRRETVRLHELQHLAEVKREELVSAKQDASSVEKLRERKLRAYQQEAQKSEEKFIDDLVCAQGGRLRAGTL